MSLAIDWSRWTTTPYYALVIFIVACGSIPKGMAFLSFFVFFNDKGTSQ